MNSVEIREWLVPVSTALSIFSVAVGIILSLRQHQLKAKAEIRLTNSEQVESDIKLLKLFTEIMSIAHARGESIVSEKMLELMLRPDVIQQLSINEIKEAAIITLPIGFAAQDAAIAAIYELGRKHILLRSVALRALESLSTFKGEVARPYLEKLKNLADG